MNEAKFSVSFYWWDCAPLVIRAWEELYIDKDATPTFCKARTVTYALRAAVNEELQNLQDAGIKPVTNSRCATPIVSVVKPNGENSFMW